MGSLRKVLFLHAAVSGIIALWLLVVPRSVVDLLSPGYTLEIGGSTFQPFIVNPGPVVTLARLLGVAVLVIAMFMVLVAQKVETVWWWSWAFVIADASVALVALFHLIAGLPQASSAIPWWLTVVVPLAFAIALLWGLFKAQQDQPIIEA